MYLIAFIQNFVKNGTLVSEKSGLKLCKYMTLGQGQEMTLTFKTIYLHYSISCLHLPTFRSQAAIDSEKSTVFTFSYRKAYVTKFDLAVK